MGILQILEQQRVFAVTKLGEVSSKASAKLQAVAVRLHLVELRDMALLKVSACKSYAVELRDAACRKGNAGRLQAMTYLEVASGNAYSLAAATFGKMRVDRVCEVVANHLPVMKTNGTSGPTAELEKNEKKD